ncbi:hypothetical protein KSS87_004527 [Heliosperma pusillum]|nr:hypothetical protein KSS87_004527 [Heliosperma pusillum]
MISGKDFYNVMTGMVPLYVAMILGYGSVKWWKIFNQDQCSGINKFVVLFAAPLLSFHFISLNNPYTMNYMFILADTLQKIIVLIVLTIWLKFSSKMSIEWYITLFALCTLPNTLVMGIPMLNGMYGANSGSLMVQIVVLQCIIWNTLLLFLFEYRGARILISGKFRGSGRLINTFEIEPNVTSLDGREMLETRVEVREDGKLSVKISKSSSSSMSRVPYLSDAEIYSLPSSRNQSFGESSFNQTDFHGSVNNLGSGHVGAQFGSRKVHDLDTGVLSRLYLTPSKADILPPNVDAGKSRGSRGVDENSKDVNMIARSSSAPIPRGSRPCLIKSPSPPGHDINSQDNEIKQNGSGSGPNEHEAPISNKLALLDELRAEPNTRGESRPIDMPPSGVMTKLILIMVWRKLVRNPNTYSSLIGLIWSLISFRWHIKMPEIVSASVTILSNTGLGMAMFSLGLFMALQPRIIACGKAKAGIAAALRFLVGPAIMGAASAAIGLRGDLLRISIVQAALPEGIIPFVFAKEYDVHADILSTSGAKLLISEQFPDTAASIISFKVDSDIISLDGKEPLETQAEIGEDGKLHVKVRKSASSRSEIFSRNSHGIMGNNHSNMTPRPSNLTNAEIYSLQSSRNQTPRGSSFNHNDFYSFVNGKGLSNGVSPRTSNFGNLGFDEESGGGGVVGSKGVNVNVGSGGYPAPPKAGIFSPAAGPGAKKKGGGGGGGEKDIHMFVWSSSASPVSEGGLHVFRGGGGGGGGNDYGHDLSGVANSKDYDDYGRDEFSFRDRTDGGQEGPTLSKLGSSSTTELRPKGKALAEPKPSAMPPASVMTRLILIMVWRKLIRNPNTYSSLIGLTWSLVSFRWHIEMPAIVAASIKILSDAGLGMAMFSLGLFMALQPRIIACGNSVAAFAALVRFITGPAVMAAASIAVGLRGTLLHIGIVQAALPQGIVPFVFAKEYNVHPDILSTAY